MNLNLDYDVAISFAGEDREIAEDIIFHLKQYGVKTFYDKDEKANLLGENLYTYLTDIYKNRAKYCIVLVSRYYKSKLWTNHELNVIQARVLEEQSAYLLPVFLDDTQIPSILPTISHLKYAEDDAKSIAQAVYEKLTKKKQEKTGNMKESEKHDLRAFQRQLELIYKNVNKNYSDEYLYGYLSRTVGYLCKNLIANNAKEIDFIRPISWLFMVASNLGIDIQEAFIKRFPECCPHCLERKCICMKTGKEPKQYMTNLEIKRMLEGASQTIINSNRMIDFDSAKKTISSIYYSNEIVWHYGGAYFHVAKLYEEVSEVHEAISKYAQLEKSLRAISDEIAEVLAWLLSAWDITRPTQTLNAEIISYYHKGCPVCRRSTCICKPNSNRFEGIVNREELTKIQDKLKELSEAVSSNREIIDELIASLAISIDSQMENLIIRSIAKIRLQLGFIEDDISKQDEISLSLIRVIFEYIKRSSPRL